MSQKFCGKCRGWHTERKPCKCHCEDHHSYHHDYGGYSAPPIMSMSGSMELPAAGGNVSTRDWSKVPAENSAVGGVYVGCNMAGSDYSAALQAIMAGVACLTADIGAGATWAQFETAYGMRKYEGDADCVFTLKPKPTAWMKSTASPPPDEGPAVVRDCLARTWVACSNEFEACETVNNADGTVTITFKQLLGDGTVVDGGDVVFTFPGGFLPPYPDVAGDDKTEYQLCWANCVNDGRPRWVEKPVTATNTTEGLVRFLTDTEFEDGEPYPAGTVLTPEQVCDKIDAAVDDGDGDGGGGVDPEPTGKNGATVTKSGNSITVDNTSGTASCFMRYFDGFGSSVTCSYEIPVGATHTFELNHDSYDPFVLGSTELFVDGTGYGGDPKSGVPLTKTTDASGIDPSIGAEETCSLSTTEDDGAGGTATVTSILGVHTTA